MIARRLVCCIGALMAMACAASLQAAPFEISSPDFTPGKPIPAKYAKKHGNLSPALRMKGVPEGTKSLILVVDDPDAPKVGANTFTHWLVWNIDPQHTQFLEGRAPRGAMQGKNSFGDMIYDGPVPPSGTHHYYFHLYALNVVPSLPAGADRTTVETAVWAHGHLMGKATMFGTYKADR